MSTFCDFLKTDYPTHFGIVWDNDAMTIRKEEPASIVFEIQDQQPTIVQPTGKGVSVIRRKDKTVEVVDFENYCKTIHGTNNTPSSCDFIISPTIGEDFILFNELTHTESGYILPFSQKTTGLEQVGKLAYAKGQLEATINRIYEVNDILDHYDNKVALFSCRLSDKKGRGVMAKSASHFSAPIRKLERMKLHETLPHGFTFLMRVYETEYRIS